MWSEKTRLPVRGRRPRTGSLVFQTTSRLEWWFVILYHITGRTPDLKCIFGNHLKPELSRPGGPIVRPQVCNSNTEFLLVWRFYPNWKYLTYFRKVKVKLSKSSTFTPQLAAGSESERMYLLLLRWKVQKSAMKMWAVATLKMDNMDMLANIVQLLSGRSGGSWTWSSPFLACRWPPLESHFVPFFSCLALIKNFGPSWSKHTTKLTKAILFSWLARDHWHWELFYKCNQCNYKYTFVENLRTHKNIFFTNASNVTTNAFL